MVVRPRAFGTDVAAELAARYPDRQIVGQDSFLSAISALGRQGSEAVLACIQTGDAQLEDAIAGFRSAAGREVRIVLCCRPESEPLARKALAAGADEYVLHPLQGPELDAALGIAPRVTWDQGRLVAADADLLQELDLLGRMLSKLAGRPAALVSDLAGVVRTALKARGVTVTVQDHSSTAGEPVLEPLLTCPIEDHGGALGRLDVGARQQGAYTLSDVQKLQHYARLAAHVLRAARHQRRWRRLAQTDDLTGLPNRRAFLPALEHILHRARQERLAVTVLVFDLDDFKSYNDAFGHDVGDAILRTTAELFRRHSREHDLVARLGGDEFAVVFFDPQGPRVAGSRHPESVLAVLDRFREALKKQVFEPLGPQGQGRLTISGGMAAFPWDGAEPEALLHRADQALLEAKRQGKNRIVLVGQPDSRPPEEPG